MIRGREKRRSKIYNFVWDLLGRMVGGREFQRVGPEFVIALNNN